MKISQLPPELSELFHRRVAEQGSAIKDDCVSRSLVWIDTPEKGAFWVKVFEAQNAGQLPAPYNIANNNTYDIW